MAISLPTLKWSKPMKIRGFVVASLMCALASTNASAQYHQKKGSILGGLAGAGIGAAIGENNDEPLAGALIGGALGLVTGNALGQAEDARASQRQAYQQYQYQQQVSGAVSTYDVAQMIGSGLSPQIVINHIQQNGVQKRPEVNDIIWLHQNRVPEQVITAMQRASVGRPVSVAPVQRAPVIAQPAPVVEYHYVSPPPVIYHRPYYHYPRTRRGVSWGFSFGR